jgi:hypothetical protein
MFQKSQLWLQVSIYISKLVLPFKPISTVPAKLQNKQKKPFIHVGEHGMAHIQQES